MDMAPEVELPPGARFCDSTPPRRSELRVFQSPLLVAGEGATVRPASVPKSSGEASRLGTRRQSAPVLGLVSQVKDEGAQPGSGLSPASQWPSGNRGEITHRLSAAQSVLLPGAG